MECLYLYREFEPEELRLLLPIADMASEQHVASFVGALELGLRQRFGGRLPHLRAMTGDNALPGASDGRRYLVLYYTVPGGTCTWLDESAPHENLFLALPLAAVDPSDPTRLLPILHLGDDEASTHQASYRPAWSPTLRLFNLLQFLPGAWWTTHQGVQAGYPDGLTSGHQTAVAATDSDDWAEAMELAAEPLRPAMRRWAATGLPTPDMGFELTDDKGEVQAEAELAWPMERVAVLHGEQAENTAAFERGGWQVCFADEEAVAERVIKRLTT